MTQPFEPAQNAGTASPTPSLSAHDVKSYLLANRELFAGDLDLMAALTPKSYREGDNVTDLQTFVINRLRADLETIRSQGQVLIETASANLLAQDRVHASVLKLLEARSFGQFIRIMTDEVGPLLGADAVIICVEAADPDLPQTPPAGIAIMTQGMVDDILGPGVSHQLNNGRKRIPAVYGPKARRIRSEALLRLSFGADMPSGLLVLGSVDPEIFAPEQRAELLNFLAHAIERCLVDWLGLERA